MFNSIEFRAIRKNCPDDLQALLENLSIPLPDFNAGDEMKIYEQLDKSITKALCFEMKSLTLITGYLKLLKMAGVKDDGSETEGELVSMVLDNEEHILKAAEKNVPKLHPDLEKSLVTYETEIMIVPLVFGAVFSIMTFFYTMLAEMYFPAVTVLGTVAGLGAIIFGLRGEKRMRRIDPPKEFLKVPPDVLNPDEVKIVIDSLKLLNRIYLLMLPRQIEAQSEQNNQSKQSNQSTQSKKPNQSEKSTQSTAPPPPTAAPAGATA